ncbi:uncharacterized protein N7477_007209 [Penicillium maclennaniae]|uniref:uncharacterized protein n=1 Tax=Penicillium maclennaniae TaxID=1343394 RepID=UPI00254059B8|nr:uncharacterized protein N7477_007209 [Penicillium maclennaniae]KAJ5668639.1 hypothetical protein N7477_007209 [Penicillium maclennaniae]
MRKEGYKKRTLATPSILSVFLVIAVNPLFKLNNPELLRQSSYVYGVWVKATSGKRFNVIDPGSDRAFASCPDNGPEDVESAHNLIAEARDDLVQILTYETGKSLAEAHGSISIPSAPNQRIFVIKQPIGPANFPIATILRKARATLAAGCTIIAKPSPKTPLTCLALTYLTSKAGFPPSVFNVLTMSLENTPSLSEALIAYPRTKKITFTGSTRVGKLIARLYARHAGQAYITANRVYIQKGIHNKFVQLLVKKTKQLVIGHSTDTRTTLGPVTTPRSLDKVAEQVKDIVRRGAKLAFGTGKPHQNAIFAEGSGLSHGVGGYFIRPTILTNMTHDSSISQEEIFGPVCAVFQFETEEEVTKWANDTSIGLISYAFTKDVDRMWRMFKNLKAGIVSLNTGNSSAAKSPFGRIKESGYSKESGKDVAMKEYLIEKTGTFTIENQY